LWILPAMIVAQAAEPPSGRAWGEGARGVLLLHDEGRTSRDWGRFGQRLAANGFHVYAPDLTGGHPEDVTRAVDWLRAQGSTTVRVVGAGLGANLGLQGPDIADLVMLSPRPSAPGPGLVDLLARHGTRPLLVVAASDDPLSARTARLVHGRARGPKHLELCPGNARGTRLLNTTPALEPLLLAWLSGTFLPSTTPPPRADEVRTSGVGELQTQGTRLDERQR
ncbi:MAG: alpha/beta fold hydrolase, partial [Myxococcota bacterium]